MKIAKANRIQLLRTYAKEIKQRKVECRFAEYPKNKAKARKAVKHLKTIEGCLVRIIERKLPSGILESLYKFGTKISITATRDSKIIDAVVFMRPLFLAVKTYIG